MTENARRPIPEHELRRKEAAENRRKQEVAKLKEKEVERAAAMPEFSVSSDEELGKIAEQLLLADGGADFTKGDVVDATREDLAQLADTMPSRKARAVFEGILRREQLPAATGEGLSDKREQQLWEEAQNTFAERYGMVVEEPVKDKPDESSKVKTASTETVEPARIPAPAASETEAVLRGIDAAASKEVEALKTPAAAEKDPALDSPAAIMQELDRIARADAAKDLAAAPAASQPIPGERPTTTPGRRLETRFSPAPAEPEPTTPSRPAAATPASSATTSSRPNIRTQWDASDRESISLPPELTGTTPEQPRTPGIVPDEILSPPPRTGGERGRTERRSSRPLDVTARSEVRNEPLVDVSATSREPAVERRAPTPSVEEARSARSTGEREKIDMNDPRRVVTIINFDGNREEGWVYHSYDPRRDVAMVMKKTEAGWATDEVPLETLRQLNPQSVENWKTASREAMQLAPWDRDVIMLERQHDIESRGRIERLGNAMSELWQTNGVQFARAAVKSLFLRSVSLAGLYSPMVAFQYGRERMKVFGGFGAGADSGMEKQLREIFAMREFRTAERNGESNAKDPRSIGRRMMDGIKGFWNETIMRRDSSDLEIQKFDSLLRFVKGGEKAVFRTKDGKRQAITTPERQKIAEMMWEMRKMRGIKNEDRDKRAEHLFDTYILTKTSGYQVAREFLNSALVASATVVPASLAVRPLMRAYFDTKIRQQRMEKDPTLFSEEQITMKEAFKSGVQEWWEHLRGRSVNAEGTVQRGIDSRGRSIGWRQRLGAAGRLYSYMGMAAGVHDFGILGQHHVSEAPRMHFDVRHPEKSVNNLLDAWEKKQASLTQEVRDLASVVTRREGRTTTERRDAEPSMMERVLQSARELRERFGNENAVKKHFERPDRDDIRELLQRTRKIPDEKTAERVIAFVQENMVASHDPEKAVQLVEKGDVDIDSVLSFVHQPYQGGSSISQEAMRQIEKRFERAEMDFDNPQSRDNLFQEYAVSMQEEIRRHLKEYGVRNINVVTREQLKRIDWDQVFDRSREQMETRGGSPEALLQDLPEVGKYMSENNIPVTQKNIEMAIEKMNPQLAERLAGAEAPAHAQIAKLPEGERAETLSALARGDRPVLSEQLHRETADALNGSVADVRRFDEKFGVHNDAERLQLIKAYETQRPDIKWSAEKHPDTKAIQLLSTLQEPAEVQHFKDVVDSVRIVQPESVEAFLNEHPDTAEQLEEELGTRDARELAVNIAHIQSQERARGDRPTETSSIIRELAEGSDRAKRLMREYDAAHPESPAPETKSAVEHVVEVPARSEVQTVTEQLPADEMEEAKVWFNKLKSESDDEGTILMPGVKVLVKSSVEEGVFVADDGSMHIKDWGLDFDVKGPSEEIRQSHWFQSLMSEQTKAYRAQFDKIMSDLGNPGPGTSGHAEQKRILFGTDDYSVDKNGNLTLIEAGSRGRRLFLPNPARFERKSE